MGFWTTPAGVCSASATFPSAHAQSTGGAGTLLAQFIQTPAPFQATGHLLTLPSVTLIPHRLHKKSHHTIRARPQAAQQKDAVVCKSRSKLQWLLWAATTGGYSFPWTWFFHLLAYPQHQHGSVEAMQADWRCHE